MTAEPQPFRRNRIVAAALLAVVGSAIWLYVRSQPPTLPPQVSAVSCRWAGHRVLVSGEVRNPNRSTHEISVKPRFRLAGGARQSMYYTVRSIDGRPLPGRASRAWITWVKPKGEDWRVGEPIVRCDATAANYTYIRPADD